LGNILSYRIFYFLGLGVCLLSALAVRAQTSVPTPAATAAYVAYLSEGNLWAMRSDGHDRRLIALAAPGEVIQDFVWSADGQRIYFAVGARFFDASLVTGNLASGGALNLPATVSLDKLELGRDSSTIIAHTLDEEGLPRVFGMPIGGRDARELSVDEYNALAAQPAPIVRRVGEMSVAPDARFILFKEAVGAAEELFVSEIETGRRWQITNLATLEGFEESAETLGGRFIIEATWSPDGRYVLFNPGQSCSETGLCYGKLYLVEMWGGALMQLSLDMMITLPLEWNPQQTLLVYDDENEIVLSDKGGQTRRLATGNRPKWQPAVPSV
jgi:Tol biopolymer transport system component